MNNETDEKLRNIFLAVFELPNGADVTKLRQISHAGWDSLAHVTLVSAIESEFGVVIPPARSLELTSFAAVRILMEELRA